MLEERDMTNHEQIQISDKIFVDVGIAPLVQQLVAYRSARSVAHLEALTQRLQTVWVFPITSYFLTSKEQQCEKNRNGPTHK